MKENIPAKIKSYLKEWTAMRFIRLGLGIIILIQGLYAHEWVYVLLGSMLAAMPVLNVGCCGAGQCRPTYYQKPTPTPEEVEFEEVK